MRLYVKYFPAESYTPTYFCQKHPRHAHQNLLEFLVYVRCDTIQVFHSIVAL